MIKRTYSKRSAHLKVEYLPQKRRRVESAESAPAIAALTTTTNELLEKYTTSSSSPLPQDQLVFSSLPQINSTPPSSPPPLCVPSSPLKDITTTTQSKTKPSKPKKKQKLTQLTLDLGQRTRKKCAQCGMTYMPSNAEDIAAHKKFHAQNIGGVDVSRRFVDVVVEENSVWSVGGGRDCIVAIDALWSSALKRKGVEVVKDVVEEELGGVKIDPRALWGESEGARTESGRGIARYRPFLYLRKQKCVGFCLVERISEAYEVLPDTPRPISDEKKEAKSRDSSSIVVSEKPQKAMMGISRIWTSNSARRSGIAVALLDIARKNFLYGIEIERDMVAFSPPTESGGRLARKWFGKESGWLVYVEP